MSSDPWLNRWLPLLLERASNRPILEIGCGSGEDTETLLAAGARVIAFDVSYDAVVRARHRAPAARILCQDVRQPFPHEEDALGAIVASLSLHYFPWIETINLVTRIQHTLRPNGLFICRLNSTQDHNYGASGHPQIDQDYYLVNGEPKRFFSSTAVDKLFERGWTVLSQEHMVTGKYAQPKALWEVVVERDAQHDGQQETTDDDLTSS